MATNNDDEDGLKLRQQQGKSQIQQSNTDSDIQGRIQGEGAGAAQPPLPPLPKMTCGFLIQLVRYSTQKEKKLCSLLVLKQSKRLVHPLRLKKILDPPLTYSLPFSKPNNCFWHSVYLGTCVSPSPLTRRQQFRLQNRRFFSQS